MSDPLTPSLKRPRDEEGANGDEAEADALVITAKSRTLNLQRLRDPRLCDLTLSVTMLTGEVQTFQCCAALIAASSRVLWTRMHGAMADTELLDKPRKDRILCIQGDHNHVHFGMLLDYMHNDISFKADLAPELYQLADFYEVFGLCDVCRTFWFDTLIPSNCCGMLQLANSVNCAPLVERCYDVLILCFDEVVRLDPNFGSLDADVIGWIAGLDTLVCESEYCLVKSLLKWYEAGDTPDAKHAALIDILKGAVRWDRVLGASAEPAASRSQSHIIDTVERRTASLIHDLRVSSFTAYRAVGRSKQPVSDGSTHEAKRHKAKVAWLRLDRVVRACLDNVPVVSLSYRAAPAHFKNNPRQYAWGMLRVHNPPLPFDQPYPDTGVDFYLRGDKDYVIGRSRSSTPLALYVPTVSSVHFRVTTKMEWKPDHDSWDPLLGIGCWKDRESSTARLVPHIKDFSSNGTFIDDIRIEKGVEVPIKSTSRINLVVSGLHTAPTEAAIAPAAIPIPPWFTFTRPCLYAADDQDPDQADAKPSDEALLSPPTLQRGVNLSAGHA